MAIKVYDQETKFEEVQDAVKTLRVFVAAAFVVLSLVTGISIGVVLYGWKSGMPSTSNVVDLEEPRRTMPTSSAPSGTTADAGKGDQVTKRVCDTEDCHYMRWLIGTSVDKSLDPCSNFYNYVCKGAVSAFKGELDHGMMFNMYVKLAFDIEQWLRNGRAQPRNQSAYEKVIATYQSCMDASDQAVEASRRYVEDFLKGHRMALTEILDFDPMTKQLEFWFADLPLMFAIEPFPRRSINQVYIQVVPHMILHRTIHGNTSVDRKAFVETVLRAIFAVKDIDGATVDSVLEGEDRIFNLSTTLDWNELIIPVSELGLFENDQTLGRRWIHAIEKYLRDDITQIKLRTPVGVAMLFSAFFGSNAVIANETVQAAVAWMLTYNLYASAGFDDDRTDITRTRQRCLSDIFQIFPSVAASKVLLEVVNRSRVNAVNAMMDEVGKQIRVSFMNSKWLDNDTKKRAVKKLSLVIRLLGYHYDMMSPQEYDNYLKYVPDMKGVYIQNILDASKGQAKHYWGAWKPNALNLSIHQQTVSIPLYAVNGVNFGGLNMIFVPAASFYRPLFTYGGPPELNYAGVGHIITHEIMHSFDNNGVYRNGYGDVDPWFTNQSIEAFGNLQACYSDQIDRAPRARAFLDYPHEYLADTLAMESLTRAYQKASAISKVTLGNVKGLTSDQLFYITGCLMWCGVPSLVKSGTHPDLDERCNVPFVNSEHFSETFSCRPDAPMNPSKKCRFF
ncbi:endothelin-converting enzyme 1-like [Ornithodoros turicata]|uniref:endothelin-converting enzyme 1-like n=1 Tax=Ornithodoros turicata TaxID=34597 RepID=UPI00313893FC